MGPRHVAAILGMLLLIAAFYTNRVFQAGFNPGEDLLDHEVPLARFFVDSILQGHFPQWNPHKACGLPACETPFMGPYYPSFLLYFVVPVEWAVNLGFVLHIGLSGWFFFLLSRQLGLSHLVAFFCASSWALSSEFQQYSESGWLSEAIATTYLPAVLWLIVRARGARSQVQLVLLMLAGGCMALSITGGHPLNSFFVMSSVVFFSSPLLRSGREIRLLGLLLLLVLLLSVVVWGPFLIQYFSFPSSQYDRQGYLPIQLLNFLLPTNIRRGFVGRPLLILAVAGLFLRRQPFAANFRVLLVISLGLSLAGSHRFFDHVPFFSGIRNTWQWHIGLIASLIVFSGFALTRLEEFLTRHFTSQWLIRSALFGLLALQLLDLYGFNQAFYPRGFT